MDIHEFLDNHKYGHDHIKSGIYGKLEYFDFERELMNKIVNNQHVVIKKSRQMHMTTLLSTYSSWFLLNNDSQLNKIFYVASSLDMGKRFIDLIRSNTNEFENGHSEFITNNSSELVKPFSNNSVKIFSTFNSFTSVEMKNVNMIIIDEAAFVKDLERILTMIRNALDTGRLSSKVKLIITSTPNDIDYFHSIYESAIKDETLFVEHSMNYLDNPRFNNDEWLEEMKKCYNFDERIIKREIYAEFVASEKPKKKKNKDNLIQFRVNDSTFMKISKQLVKKDINVSTYIRELILKDVNE